MCTTNINAYEMDRQVFWQTNYLHSSLLALNIPIKSNVEVESTSPD